MSEPTHITHGNPSLDQRPITPPQRPVGSTTPATAPRGRKRFINSCSTCRRRKVRCDREKPMCARCTTSGYSCAYTDSDVPMVPPPVGPPRRHEPSSSTSTASPQEHGPLQLATNCTSTHPERYLQDASEYSAQELLKRLQKLEEIVAALGPLQTPDPGDSTSHSQYSSPTGLISGAVATTPADCSPPRTTSNTARRQDVPSTATSTVLGAGKLLNEGGRVRYVSSLYWELITDEMQNPRAQVHEQQSDSIGPKQLSCASGSHEFTTTSQRGLQAEPQNGNVTSLIFPGPAPSSNTSSEARNIMPPQPQVYHLFTIFLHRIDPLVRLLHIPTFIAAMEAYFDIDPAGHHHEPSTDAPLTRSESTTIYLGYSTPAFEALLFSMIFAAIHSLSPHELVQHVEAGRITHSGWKSYEYESNGKADEDLKSSLLRYYRSATEQSLVRARFLERSDIVSAMALTILLICTCQESDVPTLYPLTGLLLRIAQSLGLHRDPCLLFSTQAPPSKGKERNMAKQQITPVEAEIRRRLWHHISHLDLRASEAHGPDPGNLLEEKMWPDGPATCFPRCIDDEDLLDHVDAEGDIITPAHPSYHDPGRFTKMTMQLLRFNASLCFRRVQMPSAAPTLALGTQDRDIIEEQLRQKAKAEVEVMVEANKKYLRYCDDDGGMSETAILKRLTKTLASVVENKVHILYYYRFVKGRETASPESRWARRESVLLHALDLLQSFNSLCPDPAMYPYHWHIDVHIPFHALCHLLSELCTPEFRQEKYRSIRERAQNLLNSLDWIRGQDFSEENSIRFATRRGKEWDFVRKLIRRADRGEATQPSCDGSGDHIHHDQEDIGVGTATSQNPQPASVVDSQLSFLTELGTGEFAWNDTAGVYFDQDDWDQMTRFMCLDPFSFV